MFSFHLSYICLGIKICWNKLLCCYSDWSCQLFCISKSSNFIFKFICIIFFFVHTIIHIFHKINSIIHKKISYIKSIILNIYCKMLIAVLLFPCINSMFVHFCTSDNKNFKYNKPHILNFRSVKWTNMLNILFFLFSLFMISTSYKKGRKYEVRRKKYEN